MEEEKGNKEEEFKRKEEEGKRIKEERNGRRSKLMERRRPK